MSKKARPPLKVRGVCKAGHELVTDAPPGRVTWRGPCPQGCGNTVYASRLKVGDTPPAKPPAPEPEQPPPAAPAAAPAGRPRRKVVRAGDYHRPEPKPRQEPAADVRPAPGPTGGPAPTGERDTRTPERKPGTPEVPDRPAEPPRAPEPERRRRSVLPAYEHLGF